MGLYLQQYSLAFLIGIGLAPISNLSAQARVPTVEPTYAAYIASFKVRISAPEEEGKRKAEAKATELASKQTMIARDRAASKSNDLHTRIRTISSLSSFCKPLCATTDCPDLEWIVPILREALDDSSPQVRRYAARGLGQIKLQETSEKIASMAKADPEGRLEYLWALETLAEPSAYQFIEESLNNKKDIVRNAAVNAIASYQSVEVRQLLESILIGSDDVIRATACKALTRKKDTESNDAMVTVLEDSNSAIKECAQDFLAIYGDINIKNKILGQIFSDLRSGQGSGRSFTVLSLIKKDSRIDITPPLLELLKEASILPVSSRKLLPQLVMLKLQDSQVIEVVRGWTTSSDTELKKSAEIIFRMVQATPRAH